MPDSDKTISKEGSRISSSKSVGEETHSQMPLADLSCQWPGQVHTFMADQLLTRGIRLQGTTSLGTRLHRVLEQASEEGRTRQLMDSNRQYLSQLARA